MAFKIIKKYFDKEDNLFHIIKKHIKTRKEIEVTYESFDKFYKATHKDLTDADLFNCDFENINIEKVDFKNAKISSKTMIKANIYSNKIEKMIKAKDDLLSKTPSKSMELVPSRQTYDIVLVPEEYDEEDAVILYISDIHINHKLHKKFDSYVNQFELDKYLEDILIKIKETMPYRYYNRNVIIVGDLSFDFKVFKYFFKKYREIMPYVKTFFVLGNHELWDKTILRKTSDYDGIITIYREYLNSVNITLLENELYIPSENKVYNEEQILSLTKEDMIQKLNKCSYVVFGGLGFSGLNNELNANNGIYRNAPIDRKVEIERSKRVEVLHEKLREITPENKRVIFATHMPKKDWSNLSYVKNWYYISGHTHKNYFCENDEMNVFEDNQIGYDNSSIGFKFVCTSGRYNVFDDYEDGIYEIAREDYYSFYYGLKVGRFSFNREFNKLYMIKRNGVYCFLIETKRGDLRLLNGGQAKDVGNHDLYYFYDNLENYSKSINLFLDSYINFQKDLSKEIKRIGGSGKIHGCIVDIDFWNHIYINPLDGTITPYHAYDMTNKTVYKNLISLLKYTNEDLYERYKRLMLSNTSENSLTILNANLEESDFRVKEYSREMYKISRVIKALQYTTTYNIVRVWNDSFVDDCSKENGKLIVTGVIYPESIERKEQPKQIKIKKNKEKVVKEIKPKLSEEEITLVKSNNYKAKISNFTETIEVVEYKNATEKAKYKCKLCGNEWSTRPDHFKDRQKFKCPSCKK